MGASHSRAHGSTWVLFNNYLMFHCSCHSWLKQVFPILHSLILFSQQLESYEVWGLHTLLTLRFALNFCLQAVVQPRQASPVSLPLVLPPSLAFVTRRPGGGEGETCLAAWPFPWRQQHVRSWTSPIKQNVKLPVHRKVLERNVLLLRLEVTVHYVFSPDRRYCFKTDSLAS